MSLAKIFESIGRKNLNIGEENIIKEQMDVFFI